MTASKIQLIGGKFQDGQGAALANGYLEMVLNQDGTVTGVGNICSGITIRIQLDASGSVSTVAAQYVWGNDAILPVNSYYKVTGFTATGQPAWGPNIQQVIGSGTFDCSTWIPNQVTSWISSTAGTQITLENNGTLNVSQQVLNLESTDASITITDEGSGNINLQSASSSPALPFFRGPGVLSPPTNNDSTNAVFTSGGTVVTVTKFYLPAPITVSKVSIVFHNALSGASNFGIYSAAGNLLVDSGAFNNAAGSNTAQVLSITPVALAAGTYYFAQATNQVSSQIDVMNLPASQSSIDSFNKGSVKMAVATNTYNGTVLPATLGVLTAVTVSTAVYVAMPIFE